MSRALLAGLVVCAPACALLSKAVQAPGEVLNPSSKSRGRPTRVQTAVMRFTDGFNMQIVQATQEFAEKAGTPEARIQGMSWAVAQTTSALAIACGPNPNANLLDMIVLVTIGRHLHEEHSTSEVWGEANQPMVEAYRELAEELEIVARKSLSLAELEEVREAIRTWHDEHPDHSSSGFVRLPGFKNLVESKGEKKSDVFAQLAELVSLDPLAGLKPATREVEQTRLFGERTLFYAQRAPLIFSMQAELLGLKLAAMPEIQGALETSERLSQAAEKLTETAAGLPEELTKQREGLVRDLERANEPVRELLAEARTTLDSATQTSTSLKGTIESFDAMMSRFESEPEEEGTPADEPPGRPFDVTEYGAAAARIGDAANGLDQLISAVERNQPQLERVLDETAERADRTVERSLNRALLFGLILIAASAVAVLVVRRISRRWNPPPPVKFLPKTARMSPREVVR